MQCNQNLSTPQIWDMTTIYGDHEQQWSIVTIFESRITVYYFSNED